MTSSHRLLIIYSPQAVGSERKPVADKAQTPGKGMGFYSGCNMKVSTVEELAEDRIRSNSSSAACS
jgi:hypothetical protein